MKLYFEAKEPTSPRGKIDWDKVEKICNSIFEEDQDAREYVSFKYKPDGLLCSTCISGYVHEYEEDKELTRDSQFESRFTQACKKAGYPSRIYQVYHKERFDVMTGIMASFKIPYNQVFYDKYVTESLSEIDPKADPEKVAQLQNILKKWGWELDEVIAQVYDRYMDLEEDDPYTADYLDRMLPLLANATISKKDLKEIKQICLE